MKPDHNNIIRLMLCIQWINQKIELLTLYFPGMKMNFNTIPKIFFLA